MNTRHDEQRQKSSPERSRWLKWSGISLIVLSCVLYASLLLVPFVPFSAPIKVGIGAILAILGEATFWIGGVLVGGTVIARYRHFLNPTYWLHRKNMRQ